MMERPDPRYDRDRSRVLRTIDMGPSARDRIRWFPHHGIVEVTRQVMTASGWQDTPVSWYGRLEVAAEFGACASEISEGMAQVEMSVGELASFAQRRLHVGAYGQPRPVLERVRSILQMSAAQDEGCPTGDGSNRRWTWFGPIDQPDSWMWLYLLVDAGVLNREHAADTSRITKAGRRLLAALDKYGTDPEKWTEPT